MDEAALISPSYAGLKKTAAGPLEVLAIKCSAESTGCSTKLTSSFPFEVHVVTSNAPPVDSVEVKAMVPLIGLSTGMSIRWNFKTSPKLLTRYS